MGLLLMPRGPTKRTNDLIPGRQCKQFRQPGANTAHHIFHGWLPVGGADDGTAAGDNGVDLAWANFGGAASEPGIGWEELGGESGELVGHVCAF